MEEGGMKGRLGRRLGGLWIRTEDRLGKEIGRVEVWTELTKKGERERKRRREG